MSKTAERWVSVMGRLIPAGTGNSVYEGLTITSEAPVQKVGEVEVKEESEAQPSQDEMR